MSRSGWIGVDLDGTLAEYHGWVGPTEIGEPVPAMVERVKKWIEEGAVRIFTARVYPLGYIPATQELHMPPNVNAVDMHEVFTAYCAARAIRRWCREHIGQVLPLTCVKDYSMWQLWDDRAVQVEQNTGRRMDQEPEGEATP